MTKYEEERIYLKKLINKAENLPDGTEFTLYDLVENDEYHKSLTKHEKTELGKKFYWATINTCIVPIGEKSGGFYPELLYKIIKNNTNA